MNDLKTDLNQLVIFAKVVETSSFTAAGRALGLPKSTVSRKVAQLEERLGVQLLQRTTRKLSLTEVGAAFYERCARISTEIHEAEQAVMHMDQDPRGLLRLTAPPELASAFLSEVINEYLLAYPEVDVELELTDRVVDMIDEGFDLSVRVGRLPDSSLIARKLGPVQRRLVGSPAYLARRGTPTSPSDLESHDLVVLGNPRLNRTLELRNNGREVVIAARPRLVVNSMGMLREAVLAGVGVGVLPAFKCAEDIEAGAMRSFLHDWTGTEAAIHALYPTGRHLSAKVRSFLDYLTQRLDPPPWVMSAPANKLTMPFEACAGC